MTVGSLEEGAPAWRGFDSKVPYESSTNRPPQRNSPVTRPDPTPEVTDAQIIAQALALPIQAVRAALELLEDGNTIPFIARYRKEATGGLDEVQLRAIEDHAERLRTLAARKKTVLQTVADQGALTEPLRRQIEVAGDSATLELIYLPFKPRRRTRADIARERGLQPLADRLLAGRGDGRSKDAWLREFVNPAKDVADPADAIDGALDIVAEVWSQDIETRQHLKQQAQSTGRVVAKIKRGKKTDRRPKSLNSTSIGPNRSASCPVTACWRCSAGPTKAS